jgi:hypothetical protein
MLFGKKYEEPNPLTPFPMREGGRRFTIFKLDTNLHIIFLSFISPPSLGGKGGRGVRSAVKLFFNPKEHTGQRILWNPSKSR